MYRVELKVNLLPLTAGKLPEQVPNVPCGVERQGGVSHKAFEYGFLMYRVELKATYAQPQPLRFATRS